jgi:hypothetical protein
LTLPHINVRKQTSSIHVLETSRVVTLCEIHNPGPNKQTAWDNCRRVIVWGQIFKMYTPSNSFNFQYKWKGIWTIKPISVFAQLSLLESSCVETDIYLIAHNTDTQRDVTRKIKIACWQRKIYVTFFIIWQFVNFPNRELHFTPQCTEVLPQCKQTAGCSIQLKTLVALNLAMRGIYYVLAYPMHNYEHMTDLSEKSGLSSGFRCAPSTPALSVSGEGQIRGKGCPIICQAGI